MSIGTDAIHVFYVGPRPAAVTSLPGSKVGDATFLTSVAAETDVAVSKLTRSAVDCVVCDEQLLDPKTWAFLHRLDDRFLDIPVIIQTDGTGTDVPEALYDAVSPGEEPEALAAVILDLVGADEESAPFAGDAVTDLLDRAEEYVAHVERDGTVRMVNASATAQHGLPREEIVGKQLGDLVDDATDIMAAGRKVLETGEGRELHDEQDGRHFTATFEPVADDMFEVVVRDVTATRRAEQAFREERAFLESVIDSLSEVFFVLDLEFRFVRWNDRVNEVTGWGDEELQGASALEFFSTAGAERAAERLQEVVSEGQATAELEVVGDTDADPVPFEFTSSLVRDETGEPRYICGIGRDISERRATQAELDEAISELERSNAELEQFAYVASHDLKEPLRMVSSYLQLLDRRYKDDLDEDAQEFVEFAVDGAERMQDMIRDLLEYSRVGRRDRGFEEVELERVLETAQQNLEVAIDESDATVEVGDLPTIEGERSQLVELFQNLLSNAIRYRSDATPHVEVDATREDDHWLFTVTDNGRGIPEDRIDRVFDLFYRSDVQESTGIGLALVKKIAERHGGAISVESTPGEGTTFSIRLPEEE
ncbi:sensor histidine kinase [Haloglomus halophilum]|uniref:sensor histidine kinase n=1 Tax=Haloglomus halophilum TaxID=2962672 RepID=UPI0020C9EEF2|nr:ATP-binding protein [Haloglomus halophilum]